nr:Unknown Function [uncultured bacterium]
MRATRLCGQQGLKLNIFIHEDYIGEAKKKNRQRQLLGVALFGVSFLLSIFSLSDATQWLIYLAYPFMLIGVVFWTTARTADRKLTSAPDADNLVNAEMKGLSNKYSLHHHPRVNGVVIPHLFIMPAGVLVMESSDAAGPIACTGGAQGDRWRAPSNFLDRLTGSKPQVGNPTLELDIMVAAARQLLDSIGKKDVAVKGLAIFTKNPEIEIDGCSYGAAPVNELRFAVKDLESSMGGEEREASANVKMILTSEDRRKLNNILAPVSIPANARPEKPTRPASVRRKA